MDLRILASRMVMLIYCWSKYRTVWKYIRCVCPTVDALHLPFLGRRDRGATVSLSAPQRAHALINDPFCVRQFNRTPHTLLPIHQYLDIPQGRHSQMPRTYRTVRIYTSASRSITCAHHCRASRAVTLCTVAWNARARTQTAGILILQPYMMPGKGRARVEPTRVRVRASQTLCIIMIIIITTITAITISRTLAHLVLLSTRAPRGATQTHTHICMHGTEKHGWGVRG